MPSVKVTCIDLWSWEHGTRYVGDHYLTTYGNRDCQYSKETCAVNLAQFGTRIELIQASSPYFHESFTERNVDLLFLDGDHAGSTVKKELKLYYNVLSQGGTMVLDDYQHEKHAEMTREIHNFVLSYGLDLKILKQPNNDSHLAVIEK